MSRTTRIGFSSSLDDDYQVKEIMAEMREQKIEEIVDEYKATMTEGLMQECLQESDCTQMMVDAYKNQDWVSLGSFVANRIEEYLYGLAETEVE